jgi:hypothetical protein
MEHIPTQDQFWDLAPAAERIFGHVERDPRLSGMELAFDYGLIDGPSSRAVAKFSCHHVQHAVVWVTATTQLDGTWQITHSLQWAE